MDIEVKNLVGRKKNETYKKGDDTLKKMVDIAINIGYIEKCRICNNLHYCGSENELLNKREEFKVSQLCQEVLKTNPSLFLIFFQSIKTNFFCSIKENLIFKKDL